MNRQTHYTAIPKNVKKAVYERDRCKCVLCYRFVPEECASAHFIPRSHLGLGIEENILTLCPSCHRRFDNTSERPILQDIFRAYLKRHYPEWDETKLTYTKEYDR